MYSHDAFLESWLTNAKNLSSRIRRRVWLALASQKQANPYLLNQAWGSASEALRWQAAYREKGVVGLMDAPRGGRPALHKAEILQFMESVAALDREAAGDRAKKQSKRFREALWRENRKTGATWLRKHRQYDIKLPVPAALGRLCAVHIEPQLIAIASAQRSHQIFTSLDGDWLGVPSSIRSVRQPDSQDANVLSALRVRFEPERMPSSAQIRTQRKRWVELCADLAQACPGEVSLCILSGLADASPTVQLLALLQSHRLYAKPVRGGDGLLHSLAIYSFENSYEDLLRGVIAQLFPETAMGDDAIDLYEAMLPERVRGFSWVRCAAV